MDMSKAFPSTYLSAADLDGNAVDVTIREVKMEEIGQARDDKPVLYFEGKDRGVVLNKTNTNTLIDAYGKNSDDWKGKPITVYPDKTQFQGQMVDCIRLRKPLAQANPEDVPF